VVAIEIAVAMEKEEEIETEIEVVPLTLGNEEAKKEVISFNSITC